jgi:hypothetical protein
LPYLASNAAVPLTSILLGRLPVPEQDAVLLKGVACGIFLLVLVPLVFGGKIYNSIKALMTFKLIVVLGFLLFVAIGFTTLSTWLEIASGFLQFGTVPVVPEATGAGEPSGPLTQNVFMLLIQGEGWPTLDLSMIGIVAAMAAIAGNGGLTNTPISNYTRDQGWGMGYHVGAIPSILGGRSISLSHVGKVFHVTGDSLARWRGWMRHVQREQLALWMPACILGLALPSILSIPPTA